MAIDNHTHLITTHSPRSRRRWWITLGILLFLAWLLDFNPFHPVRWFYQAEDAIRQGHEARVRDDSIDAANEAARRRAMRQHRIAPTPQP